MAFELLFSRFQWVHWVFTELFFTGVEGVSSHRDRSAKNMFLHDWTASLFDSDLKINDPIESISSEFIDVIVVIDYAVGYASLRSTWTSMKAIPREKSNLPKKKINRVGLLCIEWDSSKISNSTWNGPERESDQLVERMADATRQWRHRRRRKRPKMSRNPIDIVAVPAAKLGNAWGVGGEVGGDQRPCVIGYF